ncbi:MAG: D-2-hydroxyacid dehydrogenase [Lachnospiraceae bacterium]|nr:D-2-hydroxyacid dehydrogenase [Lachnospiraceae bacterium]
MKIVFLDRKSIGDDLDLSYFKELGEVIFYDFTKEEEIAPRVQDADIIVLNKAQINEKTIGNAKNLKLVCVTATGTNNLDKDYLDSRNIQWRNVAGYSTDSVAQHTFAILFYILEKLSYYDKYVKDEKYVNDKLFTHFEKSFYELNGKRWGIIGLGNIGRKVAQIATAYGCEVVYYSPSGSKRKENYKQVELDEILETSDILSIHAPLTDDTYHLIDKSKLKKMKSNAILVNVARGPIIVEQDLVDALNENIIAGAALDVLDKEPMSEDSPLRQVKDSTKLIITPHIAWACVEARNRLMRIIYDQIKEYEDEMK